MDIPEFSLDYFEVYLHLYNNVNSCLKIWERRILSLGNNFLKKLMNGSRHRLAERCEIYLPYKGIQAISLHSIAVT